MREQIMLECTECKRKNYSSSREMKNGSKLSIKKYCKFDRKHTVHAEKKR